MSFGDAGLNAALDGAAGEITHVALNTADPGTSGAGVDTDLGTQPVTWGTAGSSAPGEVSSDEVSFTITAAATYTHWSGWDGSDSTTATYVAGGPLDEEETYSSNGGTAEFTAVLEASDNTPSG